jgi:hypothetical protein
MNEIPDIEDDEGPKIWELKSGEEVLGTLRENDWYQPPWCGYDFEPKENYAKYANLFQELRYANDHAWANIRTATGYIPNSPEEMAKQQKNLTSLKGRIGSLRLTMHPIDKEAPVSRVFKIFIDNSKVQLIPDFENYIPPDYLEWNANQGS